MGVLDDSTVSGVPEKAAPDMVKNFITIVSNPAIFSPTVYLVPEIIKYDEKARSSMCIFLRAQRCIVTKE